MSENVPVLMNSGEMAGLDFGNFRNPEIALKEAEMVAAAFAKRAEKLQLYKQIGASKHLLIEGWQMLGAMYRVTASVTKTNYIQFGSVDGWEATAVAKHIPTGQEVSSADAMCLSDEDNWGPRPKYEWKEENGRRVKTLLGTVPTPTQQLRSMAQTRACSKVYSNLLKFVARMAGFAGTPAEEMTGHEDTSGSAPPQQHGNGSGPQRTQSAGPVISEAQGKRFFAIAKQSGRPQEQITAILQHFGFESDREISKDRYEAICAAVSNPQWAPPAQRDSHPATKPASADDAWAEIVKAYGGEAKAVEILARNGFESWSQVNVSDRTALAVRLIAEARK